MSPKQEPKYQVINGDLYNRASGKIIPDDEPVFILRARDKHAIEALDFYRDLCSDATHRGIVDQRVDDFRRFAASHPDRMKEPDS